MTLEPFWPNVRSKIDKIQDNINSHKALMTVNVTLENILRAQRARKLALDEYDRAARFREHQTFSTIRDEVRPEGYDEKLAGILQQTSEGSGAWVAEQDDMKRWLDPVDRTARCLWLCGIPGAGAFLFFSSFSINYSFLPSDKRRPGKTYLAGNIIQRLQRSGQCALFAFISHEQRPIGRGLSVRKSLLFQALAADPSLRPMLPNQAHADYPRLLGRDHGSVRDLLCSVLASVGPAFIVLDGLDEIDEVGWKDVLATVLDIKDKCVETKVLVASRDLRGISTTLETHAVATVLVNKHNGVDIREFVHAKSRDMLLDLERQGASKGDRSGIQTALVNCGQV